MANEGGDVYDIWQLIVGEVSEMVDVKILAYELRERYADLLALKREMKRYTRTGAVLYIYIYLFIFSVLFLRLGTFGFLKVSYFLIFVSVLFLRLGTIFWFFKRFVGSSFLMMLFGSRPSPLVFFLRFLGFFLGLVAVSISSTRQKQVFRQIRGQPGKQI